MLIADYQVLTDRDVAENLPEYVEGLVLDYPAVGIDPTGATVFAHSQVPELNQLLLPFLSLVTVAELGRNPTVKEEIAASRQAAVSGLMFTYPVHQAADILACGGEPGSRRQGPAAASRSDAIDRPEGNNRYGKLFPEPDVLLSEAPSLLGLDGQKMSKSRNNTIPLSAGEDETARLIKRAKPDSERRITYDPENRPEVSSLVLLAALCQDRSPRDLAEEIGDGGAGTLKKVVTESVNEHLRPIRKARAEYARDRAEVRRILERGNEKARATAADCLQRVREHMGMAY